MKSMPLKHRGVLQLNAISSKHVTKPRKLIIRHKWLRAAGGRGQRDGDAIGRSRDLWSQMDDGFSRICGLSTAAWEPSTERTGITRSVVEVT